MIRTWPWQDRATAWARGRPGFPCFMEMRLGKSLAVSRWATGDRCLITAPLSVVRGWYDQLCADDEPEPVWIRGSRAQRVRLADYHSSQRWFLVGLESLRATPELCDLPWGTVIVDESTAIANPRAAISKLVMKRLRGAPQRAVLAGEPAPEHEFQYFNQMAFANGSFMGCDNFWKWRARWFRQDGYDWIPTIEARAALREELGDEAFVLKRTDVGVGSKKVREQRWLDLPRDLRRVYDTVEREWVHEGVDFKYATTLALRLKELCGGSVSGEVLSDFKLRELLTLLRGELVGQPVVVWGWFRGELTAIHHALTDAGIPCDVLHGDVPPAVRARVLRRFQDGEFRVLVAQEDLARFGLDASVADTAIYYTNSWSGLSRIQSEDRLIHVNKKRPVLYIDLVARDTVEEVVPELLAWKRVRSGQYLSASRAMAKLRELRRRVVARVA